MVKPNSAVFHPPKMGVFWIQIGTYAMEKNKTPTYIIKDVSIYSLGCAGLIDIIEADRALFLRCVIYDHDIFLPNKIKHPPFQLCALVDCNIQALGDAPLEYALRGNNTITRGTYNGSPVAEFRTSW